MSSNKDFGYTMETKASAQNLEHRELLYQMFKDRPMPDDQLLICLGLFMRSSALTKILFVNEAYQLILNQPGVIVEFGTWWGQNMVLFENLRAIYEPFNQSRRVIGFDTFQGYPEISDKDRGSETIKIGGYKVAENYREYLEGLIDYHEKNNFLAAIKPSLVPGSVVMLDELNNRGYPGETRAFKEVFNNMKYRVKKSQFMTDRTYIIIE